MKKEREDSIAKFWKKNDIYQKAKALGEGGKKYFFLDGPPYATGAIHMGTALNKILKDNYLRFFRMKGFDVWDQPGYDTHGLPIENKVEKKFGFKSKNDIEKFGIEQFTKECRSFATEFIEIMSSQFENLGVWMDWDNPYLTLNNEYIEGAWHTFKIGFEKGLLYQGLYPVHICPHCETAVAYNEIEYIKSTDPSIFVKFPVKGKPGEFLVIWTTTPWTLPGNTGIMANPSATYVKVKAGEQILILAKPRLDTTMEKAGITNYHIIEEFPGKELFGLEYIHPLEDIFTFQKDLKNAHRIVLSEQYVSMEDGSGLVHTAPGHGKEDYKVGCEFDLPALSPTRLNGTFDERCGPYAGKKLKEADPEIIQELDIRGLLLQQEKITHDYPQCWRCKSLLLTMSVPQWFFRITDIKQKLIEENGNVNWYPKWGGQRFQNWLESLGDWPVSRQRYWGIPLPIWACEKCSAVRVIGSSSELPSKPSDLHRPYIDEIKLDCICGGKMKRIPDVLDVWFDSGLASWASLGYPKNKELFEKLWPSDLNIEGSDQIRGWWNSEIITSMITFDKAPFRNIILHGLVLDLSGSKMSKSRGNVVTPEDVVSKHGRDVMRFYLLSNPPWEDFKFDWREIENISKSFVVIENTFNFVKTYSTSSDHEMKNLQIEDRWLLSRLNTLVKNCTESYEGYHAHKACQEIKDFIIEDFSRWYIKLIRDRVWPSYEGDDKKAAIYSLNKTTETVVKLMAPSCPFLAEEVYKNILKGEKESVHFESYPTFEKKMINEELEKEMIIVKKVVEASANLRAEKNVKLRWPLQSLSIETKDNKLSEEMKDILKRMCNVKEVEFGIRDYPSKEFDGGTIYIDTKITPKLMEEALLREILRKVQEMRKKAGLIISDRIKLEISGCSELNIYEGEIKKEVGAEKVIFTDANIEGNGVEELKFEDRSVKIEIERIN